MIIHSDCIQAMAEMEPSSIDAIVCPVCGKEYTRRYPQKDAQAHYCSRECAYKGRSLGITVMPKRGTYNVQVSKKTGQWLPCEVCGEPVWVTPSSGRKYCSRPCFEVAHSTYMAGENNPSYVDGSSYHKRTWRGQNWGLTRKLVYERDNWTCQKCGKHCQGREIQCHHIKKWKDGGDNSLLNLITLCVSCHGMVDQSKEVGKWERILSDMVTA